MTPLTYTTIVKQLGFTPITIAPHLRIGIRQSQRFGTGESKVNNQAALLLRLLEKGAVTTTDLDACRI